MADTPEPGVSTRNHRSSLLIAFLGLILAVAGWFAYQTLSTRPTDAEAAAPAAAWPTLPATVTPLPTAPLATPPPTPTPLPTPAVERIVELATLAHTFEVIQEATPAPEANYWERIKQALPGEDRIVVATSWKARYGVKLDEQRALQMLREDKAITLTLPPVMVLGVEEVGDARPVLISQQFLVSEAPELMNDARDQARNQAWSRARANQEMLAVAKDLTRLRLIDWMRELGYTSVTVTFDSAK